MRRVAGAEREKRSPLSPKRAHRDSLIGLRLVARAFGKRHSASAANERKGRIARRARRDRTSGRTSRRLAPGGTQNTESTYCGRYDLTRSHWRDASGPRAHQSWYTAHRARPRQILENLRGWPSIRAHFAAGIAFLGRLSSRRRRCAFYVSRLPR